MRIFLTLLLNVAALHAAQSFDVVVYGGTPGGIASAITAARLGQSVALLEYHNHLGGMSASGLGKSDIETREAVGGLFGEFVGRIYRHYSDKYGADSENVRLCREGYYYEPSVAEKTFDAMTNAEEKIRVFRHHRLDHVIRSGNAITSIRVTNRTTGVPEDIRGKIFIDATYEGDLAAYAGARYRLGRESRAEFNEVHAGVIYLDFWKRNFLAGSTGEGDRRLQAYTFRLCLSSDPANSYVLRDPPPDYDRTRYLGYLDDAKAGRMDSPPTVKPGRGHFQPFAGTAVRAFSLAEIPNNKTDINMNPKTLGFPFSEENYDYPEASWEEREKITARIRNLTLGLLYFLQNDPAVPRQHRDLARRYHLAKDEFTDNDHFPWQLYVREARRIRGLYTLSEHDAVKAPGLGRTPIHRDSIAAGEFPIDSFPTRKREPGHEVTEGYIYMLDEFTRPYQIPYRIMVPEEVDALLVPVAASATHVAFSTIRLEPTWMALGQAAGAAAHLAIRHSVQPRNVDAASLQRLLLKQDQIITYFNDIDRSDPAHQALQYFGTKGFFEDYQAKSADPLDRKLAAKWLAKALPGHKLETDKSGPLTRAELTAVLLGQEAAQWTDPNNRNTQPHDPVRRGEFCRALYARMEGN